MTDVKGLVERGYDQIADRYLEARVELARDDFLTNVAVRLPPNAAVLDVGCGAGVPVARYLSERFRVVGVDISEEQVRRARELVPQAAFCRMDMTALGFPDESFDAICSLYAIFHVPRGDHPGIFESFHRLLKPAGRILVSLGCWDMEESVERDWLGAPMFWSSFRPEKSLEMIREAGFEVVWSKTVSYPDIVGQGEESHLFVLARKP
jgi:cyclopropane fatty-acyl-phospholipid synthase-like methyltransferase